MVFGGGQQQAIAFLESILDEDTFNKLLPKLHAYPNPSNGNVSIEGNGRVKIYDMNGRKIQSLIHGIFDSGYQEIHWDAGELSSGIYFIQMSSRDFIATKKVTLIK